MNDNPNHIQFSGDNPIRDAEHDCLERAKLAEHFARKVLAFDTTEGATVGVFGRWGSGKSSFVNLTRKTFKEAGVPVLDFNPWMFTSVDQLVQSFFTEVSAGLKLSDLGALGKALEEYGGVLSGKTGKLAKMVGIFLRRQEGGIAGRRTRVAASLRKRNKPIVVVLDDVDRLSAPEIREVFKLIRLTASFPNLIYIVPCDRQRVEAALEEQVYGLSGSDYLEKIIQWSFNLPEVPIHLLRKQLWESVERALADVDEPGRLDEQIWPDIRAEIIEPLIRNIRDVRRYAMAIRETVAGLDGQIALVDVLGLEAVRVFLPDVFARMPGAMEGLTFSSRSVERRLDRIVQESRSEPILELNNWLKSQIIELLEAAAADGKSAATRTAREVVEAMIDRLFPFGAGVRQMNDTETDPHVNDEAAEHLVERRVAHEQVLRLYLERVVSPDLLAFRNAEHALARMADRHELDGFLRNLDATQWQDVVWNLRHLSERFIPAHVEPGVVVLLNLWPDMPERPGSSPLDDARSTVRAATFRLLSTLEGSGTIEAAVRCILPDLRSLSPKVELVLQVGHREKSGRQLVSKAAADEFETLLRTEIRAATADDLAEERAPSRVVIFGRQYVGPSEQPLSIEDSPKLTFALLRDVQGQMTIGSLGSRAVLPTATLDWGRLVDLYGCEDLLRERIDCLMSRFDDLKPWLESQGISFDAANRLIQLAEDYLSGLKPNED